MSDLERYIRKREKKNPNFRAGLEEERRNLRIGLLIKELRLEKGMTQEQLAREIHTTKSAISRLENHAEHYSCDAPEGGPRTRQSGPHRAVMIHGRWWRWYRFRSRTPR